MEYQDGKRTLPASIAGTVHIGKKETPERDLGCMYFNYCSEFIAELSSKMCYGEN
jgi:hypothetical protein